ncbi:MAG: hypothetical protein ABIK07_00915 [Planctomycetota bacterium]
MKLLKAENNKGYFLTEDGKYETVDKMDKDGLYFLVNLALEGDDEYELDPYDPDLLPNQGHQIIYKSLQEKLSELVERRDEFRDQSERLYLDEYERYKADTQQQDVEPDANHADS